MADLGNIDAEIKRINELKDKYQSLLSVEQEVNKSLIYSSGVRKKYTDALKAASEIQKDIVKKERDYENSITKNSQAVTLNMKKHKSLKLEQAKLIKDQKALKTSGKKNSAMWKENNKKIKDLQKSISATESAIKSYENAMDESIKDAEAMKNSTKGLKKVFDQIAKIDDSQVGSQDELNSATRKRISLMKQQLNIQEKAGVLSAEDSKELKGKLNKLDEMHTIQGDLIKGSVSDDLAPMIDDLTKEAKNIADPKKFKADPERELARSRTAAESKMGLSLRGAQATSLKTIFSGKTSFGDKLKAAGSFKDASKDISKLNDVMKVTGKGASTAGGMMKMLGTALGSLGKLGWIGLIISAVTAVAKAVNDLDKFLKGFNQTFAQLQGPTVMMDNVEKSMDNFTDAIFNLQRNLKYGLKSEEIIGMFKGISESGMSLQGLLRSVQGGYSKMIEDAAKVSLNFGVSVEEAGTMLGEQMTDLRSTVDEAADSFKVLSYDASLAGIQSQKFYQATYAAAEALSYYGKFLTTASNTLKKFQDQGGMGFKDAQQQTQTMTNLFKDMDKNMRVAFIEMSGGVEAYRADFVKAQKDASEAIKKHSDAIAMKRKGLEDAKRKGDKETIDRLNNEIAAEEKHMTAAEKTFAMAGQAAKSNAQDMAMYLEVISDKVGEKMGEYFKNLRKQHGPDVFKDARAVVEHMKTVLGVSDEFAMKMVGTIQTTREGIKRMAEDVKSMSSKLPGIEGSKFDEKIYKIIEAGMEGDKMNIGKIQEGLKKYGDSVKMDMSPIFEYVKKFPNSIKTLVQEGYDKFIRNVDDIAINEQKNIEQVTGEGDKEQANRLDDLVKNTHSIDDFIGINKENAKYFLAGNDLQKTAAKAAIGTARSAVAILNYVQNIATGKKSRTEEEFRKSDDYKTLGKLLEKEMILQRELDTTPTKDKDKRAALENKIKEVQGIKKGIAGSNLYQESELVGQAAENVNKLYKDKATLDRQVAALEKKAIREAGYDRDKTENVISSIKRDFEKRTFGIGITNPEKVEQQKDFKAGSDGYALLSKGDVVVNARSMSTGVGGDIGAFAGTAASSLMKNISSGQSPVGAPQIPVNINIGSISGDPEEFLQRIKPAIEQAFERMYYDKQKRV